MKLPLEIRCSFDLGRELRSDEADGSRADVRCDVTRRVPYSTAAWAREVDAPILLGPTKRPFGGDIVQPLVSSVGDTTLVDQILEAVGR